MVAPPLPAERDRWIGSGKWGPRQVEQASSIGLLYSSSGTEGAFLPHTWSLEWANFAINGESVGEVGIEACFAGYFGVPLILVQGEEAACREAELQFPGVVTAAVKRAECHDLCSGLDQASARRLTAENVAQANRKDRSEWPAPYKPSLPMRVAVRLVSAAAAAKEAAKPEARRIDESTVEWLVPRQCDAVKGIANAGLE